MICPINLKLECDGILQIYFFSLWPHIISLDFQKETKCKPNFLCVWVGGFWVWGGGLVLIFSLVLHQFQLLHFDPQKFELK